MKINHNEKSMEEYRKNGVTAKSIDESQITVLQLIVELIKILFRHGNQEVYYHICGNIGKDAWDCPMQAEGLSVRMTNCGKKLTMW